MPDTGVTGGSMLNSQQYKSEHEVEAGRKEVVSGWVGVDGG